MKNYKTNLTKNFLHKLNTKFTFKEDKEDEDNEDNNTETTYIGKNRKIDWDEVKSECDSLKNNRHTNSNYNNYSHYSLRTPSIFEENFKEQKTEKTKHNELEQNELECEEPICSLCCDKEDSALIILSCNHTFHINCIVEHSFTDDYPFVDIDYIKGTRCVDCGTILDSSEIMYIHDKYYNLKEINIEKYKKTIKDLEVELNIIKSKIKNCTEHKQKLEYSRDKSKKICLHMR